MQTRSAGECSLHCLTEAPALHTRSYFAGYERERVRRPNMRPRARPLRGARIREGVR